MKLVNRNIIVFLLLLIGSNNICGQSFFLQNHLSAFTNPNGLNKTSIYGSPYNYMMEISPDEEAGCKIKFGRSLKINCDKIFYRGTIFTISYLNGSQRRDSFILAECFEKKYVFQIISISAPFSGMVFGYIEKGILQETHDAITFEELVDGIKKNLINPELESLKIRDEYNVRFD